jgi:hypothetical protein
VARSIPCHDDGRRKVEPVAAAPVTRSRAFPGYSIIDLMDVLSVGVLEQVIRRRTGQLTEASIRRCTDSRDAEEFGSSGAVVLPGRSCFGRSASRAVRGGMVAAL